MTSRLFSVLAVAVLLVLACGGSPAPGVVPGVEPTTDPLPEPPAPPVAEPAAAGSTDTCCCEVWLEGPEFRRLDRTGCEEGTDPWLKEWGISGSCVEDARCSP